MRYHLFIILLDIKKVKRNYNYIFNLLRKKGVMINLHYRPIHLQPYYKKIGFKQGDFPIAEDYGSSAISLPLYIDLSFNEQKKIIGILKSIIL